MRTHDTMRRKSAREGSMMAGMRADQMIVQQRCKVSDLSWNMALKLASPSCRRPLMSRCHGNGCIRMSAMIAGEIAQMRLEKEQETMMETERADHQMRIVSDLGIADLSTATAMIERTLMGSRSPRRRAPSTPRSSHGRVRGSRMLEAAQYQRAARLTYCFVFKRWFDLLFASVLLVILAPVLLSSPVPHGWICAGRSSTGSTGSGDMARRSRCTSSAR